MTPTFLRRVAAGMVPIAVFSVLACCGGCAPLVSQVLGAALGNTSPLAPVIPPEGKYVSAAPLGTIGPTVRSLRFPSNLAGGFGYSVDVSVTTPRTSEGDQLRSLRRALLSPPAAPPCTAGWTAESVWLANQQRWDRPLPLADGLDLAFPLPRQYLRESLVLDLVIEDATGSHCNRLPLGSPDEVGMTREEHTSGGGGFGLILGRPVQSGVTAANRNPYGFAVMGSFGRWLGRWRLGGRLEACFGSCAAGDFITAPAVATVERLFYRGGLLTIAASVGYQVGRIEDAINSLDGHATWAHGPRVSVLVLGPRPFAGANPSEGFAARGLEIFLQRQFFSVGAATREPPTWLLGLAVVAL